MFGLLVWSDCCFCCFRYTGASECEWTVDPAFEPMRLSSIIYFASAAVAVDSSHMTASSFASWSRFSPPSDFVSGSVSTMWFMVCRWSQSQEDCWATHNEYSEYLVQP